MAAPQTSKKAIKRKLEKDIQIKGTNDDFLEITRKAKAFRPYC